MISTVHGPKPGRASSRARASSQSFLRPQADRAVGEGGDQRGQGGAAAARHGELLRIEPGELAGAREEVGEAAGRVLDGRAVRGGEAGRVGAGGGGGDLLAENGPDGELGGVDGTRHAPARRLGDERREDGVGGEPLVHGDRVGVEVEQAAAAADGEGEVAQVGEGQPAADVVGGRGEGGDARTVRQVEGAAVGAVAPLLDAGDGGGGEVPEDVVRGEGGAQRQPQRDRLRARGRRPAPGRARLRARSSVGESAYTSRTVSLKVRTEEKPAAKAMSAIGRVVVSMSRRAVWARWARASASGPAPSSARSWRSIWRVL